MPSDSFEPFLFSFLPSTTCTTLSHFRDTKSNSLPRIHLQQTHLRTLPSHNFLPTTITIIAAPSTYSLSRHRRGSSLRSRSRSYSPAKYRIHQFHLNKLSYQPCHQTSQSPSQPPQTGKSTILFLICSVGIPSISKHSWQLNFPQSLKSIPSKPSLTKQCCETTSLRSGLIGRRQTEDHHHNRPVSKLTSNPIPSACPQFNFWIQLMVRVPNNFSP